MMQTDCCGLLNKEGSCHVVGVCGTCMYGVRCVFLFYLSLATHSSLYRTCTLPLPKKRPTACIIMHDGSH